MNKITFFGNTDVGKQRTNNEDAYIVQNIWDSDHILAVAIDGVGGYEGGEIASSIAKKSIVEYLEKYPDGERCELLKQAVIYANNTIYEERERMPQYSSMSCVLTAVLIEISKRRINMAHVGDTRLYQYSKGRLVKLSHDHSVVGYKEENGYLTEQEAMAHPQRNIISRVVGSRFIASNGDFVEVAEFNFAHNSILMLCSDGLCDMITSQQMVAELECDMSLTDKVNNLIAAANNAGGRDNITVVLVESYDPDYVEPEPMVSIEPEESIESNGDEEQLNQQLTTEVNNIDVSCEQKTNDLCSVRSKYIKTLLMVCSVFVLVVIGYVLGGFTGGKLLPSIFSTPIQADTTVQDVVVIDLQSDTTELRRIIEHKDSSFIRLLNDKMCELQKDTIILNQVTNEKKTLIETIQSVLGRE